MFGKKKQVKERIEPILIPKNVKLEQGFFHLGRDEIALLLRLAEMSQPPQHEVSEWLLDDTWTVDQKLHHLLSTIGSLITAYSTKNEVDRIFDNTTVSN